VRASFCCLLFSWLAAGAASLAWLIGVTPPRPANALAHCLPIRRRIFILAAVVAAAAAAAYLTGKTWGGHGYSGAAGPIEAGFLLPHGKAGMSDPLLGTGHPPAGFAEDFGPVHMIVTLPSAMTGRREPILTTGRNGAGDVIYVFYEDTKHIRIGFDHWSVGGQLSAPIAVDYAEPHEIWILEGALFPELGDEARWGATTPDTRKLLKSKVAVVLDGETVIDESSSTYPSTRKEITPAKNKIGASTADPVFSGALLYSERTGTFIPPGFKL
jgi:hypothetical protein